MPDETRFIEVGGFSRDDGDCRELEADAKVEVELDECGRVGFLDGGVVVPRR